MGETPRGSRDAIATALVAVPVGGVVVCIVAGLVDGLGAWVLGAVAVLAAVLAVGVGRLKWREVRATRGREHADDAVHELYSDALDRAEQGDLVGAGARFEEALTTSDGDGDGDAYTMDLLQGLAAVRVAQGRTGRAVEVWHRAYQLQRDEYGDDSVPAVAAANGLAAALLMNGERDAAGERYRDTLDRCRRLLGAAHPETVVALNGVTRTGPAPEHGPVADLYARLLGPSHPDTRIARRQASPDGPAIARLAAGDLAGARASLEQSGLHTAGAVDDYAMVLREQRDLMAAYRAYERAADLGGERARYGIALVMLLQGDETNATAELRAVVEDCVARYGEEHPETLAARRSLDRVTGASS